MPYTDFSTSRLRLRKIETQDAPKVFELRTDLKVNTYIKRVIQNNVDETRAFIEKILDDSAKDKIRYWAIWFNNEFAGTICLWNISEDGKYGEVGYELFPAYQNQGFMSEALAAVVENAFANEFEIIDAYTHKDNTASKKMLEKRGFKIIPGKKDENNANNLIYQIAKNV